MAQNYMSTIFQDLDLMLEPGTVILGIGNTLRNDDGLGVLLARGIQDKIVFKVFEGGLAPENFLGSIVRLNPRTVLLVDAVDFQGNAGEIRIFDLGKLKSGNFFLTHNHSLDFLAHFLKENSRAFVYLLAVQPKDIGIGEKISLEVEGRLVELKNWFLEKYGRDNH